MVKIKYNTSGVDRSKDGDFVPPKPGVYPMKIETATFEKANKDHPVDRVVFVLRQEVEDPEGNGKGYGFWKYVNLDEASAWVMDMFLRAIGIDTESNPAGEVDTKTFENKQVLGRVKSDYYGEEYRPKLGRVMPFKGAVDEEDWDTGSTVDTEAGAEPDQVITDPAEYEPAEIEAFGAAGDEGDEDSQNLLTAMGEQGGLDANDYPTWEELAAAIVESMVPAEEPAKPVKAAAKKGGAAKPKGKAATEPEPEAGENYEEWSLEDINAELEARSLPKTGPMSAKITRLRANDADPFSG